MPRPRSALDHALNVDELEEFTAPLRDKINGGFNFVLKNFLTGQGAPVSCTMEPSFLLFQLD